MAVTGTGTSTYASAMGTVLVDLATLYSNVGASIAGSTSGEITDTVDAITRQATPGVTGTIDSIDAIASANKTAADTYEAYVITCAQAGELSTHAQVYNNSTSGPATTREEELTILAGYINTSLSAINSAEGSTVYTWDSSSGVVSGNGSLPLASDAKTVLQGMANVYNAVTKTTGPGDNSIGITIARLPLNANLTNLYNDNNATNFFGSEIYHYASDISTIARNTADIASAYNDGSGTNLASIPPEISANISSIVTSVNNLKSALGSSNPVYAWDAGTSTLSGLGNDTYADASTYEALMQDMVDLYNSINASYNPGTNDAGVTQALANLGGSTTTAAGSLAAFSASSGGTPTGNDAHEIDWGGDTYQDDLSDVIGQIEDVEGTLKTQSSKLANNLAIITQREDFTTKSINILEEGADNLTLADMNEEGANLLALQTAQSLSVQSLSLASEQASNVLQLIQ